ncbi:autotransporter outer membrane beta-barrel domain-containing protein [Sphingobium yanoikuyae]|uniref:autotransporter outer membrane beta-barrel domain-containing protein n=1 Tax=Sphingobium yanoikuyae TaxID=13690 RepID=UPI0026E926B0|nr:autotransporter outer membrane beta-barrel domain-containing protein [Sphingobium yanoikuyae]
MAAMAAASATPAWAQCAPDPTIANGVTECSGIDADGLRINTDGSTIIVASSAQVRGRDRSAIIVDILGTVNNYQPRLTTIMVDGQVDGGLHSGIAVLSGSIQPGSYDFYGTQANIVVTAGARITGSVGITAESSTGNEYGAALISLTNAGTISGSNGIAMQAITPSRNGFASIDNQEGGSIGAIVGTIGRLTNAGLIDGGTRSAIDQTSDYNSAAYPYGWTNSGTIRSTSSAATIANLRTVFTGLSNSGTIANGGSGAAIQDSGNGQGIAIDNLAGGRISTAGPVAIAANALKLNNAGTITGDIVTIPVFGYSFFSSIDSTQGRIEGNVTLGGDRNEVYARYDGNPTLQTGITGTISVAGDNNSLILAPTTDLVLSTAITLPTGFSYLRIAPDKDATLSLAAGFITPGTLILAGQGKIINDAAIVTNGPAFASSYMLTGAPSLVNRGTVDAQLTESHQYAIDLSSYGSLDNSGTIRSSGNGVNSDSSTVNSGTITAAGTALSMFGGALNNSGTIRSTNDIGIILSGNANNIAALNSGLIEGKTFGAIFNYAFNNSGTIRASGNGTAIGLNNYAVLTNLAGGTISGGGSYAITGHDYYGSNDVDNATVINAGTINGDVSFLSSRYSDSEHHNIYVAQSGGILNGDLELGHGDTLVTDIVNDGPGQFAGINGIVKSNGGLLRYRVTDRIQATIGPVGPFATTGYELADDAYLTLTASSPQSLPLLLAGNGTVDLTADIGTTNETAIARAGSYNMPGNTQTLAALHIINRGTLSGTRNDYWGGGFGVASLYGNDILQNEGTIKAAYTATNGGDAFNVALAYGGTLINNGRIELEGSYATYNVPEVINSGTITQIGTRTSHAFVDARSITNSGIIDMADEAIIYYTSFASTLTNTGLIHSRNASAIAAYSYPVSIRNDAGGIIETGSGGDAIYLYAGGSVSNAGTINGNVRLSPAYYGFQSGLFYADGGVVNGDVLFGMASDIFIQVGENAGVTGTIDGGNGTDIYGRIYQSDATIALDDRPGENFELDYVGAASGTVLTIAQGASASDYLFVGGEGMIINNASLDSMVTTDLTYYFYGELPSYLARSLGSFVNKGQLNNGLIGQFDSIINDGRISATSSYYGPAVSQFSDSNLQFVNNGTIARQDQGIGVALTGINVTGLSASNSGLIDGGMDIIAVLSPDATTPVTISNSGSILSSAGVALRVSNQYYINAASGTYHLDNSGLIETGAVGSAAVDLSMGYGDRAVAVAFDNSGTIRANAGGVIEDMDGPDDLFIHSRPSSAVALTGNGTTTLALNNAEGGTIEATGNLSTAIWVTDAALTLDNAGTIHGGAGTVLADTDQLALALGTPYLAGAIQAVGNGADSIQNSGTIIGSIDLGAGDDVIVNRGTIIGDVYLRDGNDSFTQLASAIMQGIVDGGAGTDNFIVDATGGGAINADQFINFERFLQIGEGNVTYSGDFSFDTIGLDGGTVTVAAGETLSSSGIFTITGGAGNDSVRNAGTISGGIDLAGGDDSIVNDGVIGGPVLLGAGNDSFTEGAGSSAGLVNGGAGTDLYRVILAGDRSGIGAQTGFEQLSIEGQGTLTLGLGQGYDAIALLGTNLNLATNGQFVGQILGSDAQEQLRLTGDVSAVQLGAGNDALTFDQTRAAGRYDGGAGQDSLSFTAQGPVTLAGTAIGFEALSLAGGHLIVTGQLGSADGALRFGDGGEQLDIAAGGRLLGQIDMGGGDDIVRLADGALWQGILSGGAGHDSLSFGLSSARTLDGNSLTGFEALLAQGSGTLTLVNGFTLQSLGAQGDLTLASGASLTTDKLTFGDGDNRFTINGLFTGAVDGGAGNNRILLNGGSASAPVRFSTVSNIAGLDVSGGYATVSGSADFGIVDLSGGRLVGLAGSTIRGSSILVRQGATFGSAGTVVGDIHVAGTLSPGASPGTMTVTGNVALAGGSTTLMEITPTLSDQLVISGTLMIAQGASLVLSADQQIKPGTTLDLIIAHGGISGSYTNIVKPDTLFGFIVQDDERIRLLGQFLNNGSYTPQVQRAIDYTNAVIASGTASEGLIDALPVLATASGASNPAAFARLTAEPYAAATQMGVENGLAIANATRSIARLSADETPRAFSIGQYLGGLGRIAADDQAGLSASRSRSYGLLGGLGIGTDRWSIAGFGGYLDSRQTLRQLGSQTDADGWLAGIAGSYALGALRFDATLAYHQLDADTDRLTPDGSKAHGRFRLKNWIGDLSLSYEAALGSDWAARPDIGLTYVATTRTGLREESSNVWALDVARDDHDALFADGGVAFGRSRASDARFRPFVRLGVQYQLQGRGVEALAGFTGTDQGLLSLGARRGGLVGSVSGGAEMRVGSALSLFANASQTYSQDDRRASANIGMRLAF